MPNVILSKGQPHLMTGPRGDTKLWPHCLIRFRTTVKGHYGGWLRLPLQLFHVSTFSLTISASLTPHGFSPESMTQYTSCRQIPESQVCFWETGFKIHPIWASLLEQWLRVRLPMQGTRVRAPVREDPACRGAAGPMSHGR